MTTRPDPCAQVGPPYRRWARAQARATCMTRRPGCEAGAQGSRAEARATRWAGIALLLGIDRARRPRSLRRPQWTVSSSTTTCTRVRRRDHRAPHGQGFHAESRRVQGIRMASSWRDQRQRKVWTVCASSKWRGEVSGGEDEFGLWPRVTWRLATYSLVIITLFDSGNASPCIFAGGAPMLERSHQTTEGVGRGSLSVSTGLAQNAGTSIIVPMRENAHTAQRQEYSSTSKSSLDRPNNRTLARYEIITVASLNT